MEGDTVSKKERNGGGCTVVDKSICMHSIAQHDTAQRSTTQHSNRTCVSGEV